MAREKLDLSGVWRFLPDPRAEAEATTCSHHAPDTRQWREAWIPSTFEGCMPELEGYEGAVWFARHVPVPMGWGDRRVVLRFEGVNYHAAVWMNGREAGGNADAFLPFELEVTGLVRPGDTSLILVRVDNSRREPDLPGSFTGWRDQGGILRDVTLVATDRTYLAEVHAEAGSRGELTVSWVVRNTLGVPRRFAARLRVRNSAGTVVGEAAGEPTTVAGGLASPGALSLLLANAAHWSPKHPVLYTAELDLLAGGELVDEVEVRFGFRTVRILDGRLLLNGELLHLAGWNRHEDSPTRGLAQDLPTARSDLKAMKEAGANFIRLCHYPHHPAELDMCDEIGLLAMGEIPLYGWGAAGPDVRPKLDTARRQLERMIRRDWNHPSVAFWSVSNETDEQRPEVVETNRTLLRNARSLDPSRLAVHVSYQWRDAPHFEEDDVVCVNGYPAVDGPHRIRALAGIAEAAQGWMRDLEALHAACPGKPVLVTEFGFPAMTGTVGDGMALAQQARVIEAELRVFRSLPYVCGATIWCWADHLWPVGVFDNGAGVSPYGVLTRSRHALPAFETARRLFRELRDGGAPPSEASQPSGGPARPGSAGASVLLVRLHLRDVSRFPLPAGYTMRPLEPTDAGLWTDVVRDAEEHLSIDDGLFQREFGEDPGALAWRAYAAIDGRGLAAGVITAWYERDFRGEDWGAIRWLAVRRSRQGLGIGRGMLSFALERLATWHERALVQTDTGRTGGIGLFLGFGFEPDLEPPGALAAWQGIARELAHPALEALRE